MLNGLSHPLPSPPFPSFAPRGFNDVQIIIPGVASYADLSEKQIEVFCDTLVKLLKGYNSVGTVNNHNHNTH